MGLSGTIIQIFLITCFKFTKHRNYNRTNPYLTLSHAICMYISMSTLLLIFSNLTLTLYNFCFYAFPQLFLCKTNNDANNRDQYLVFVQYHFRRDDERSVWIEEDEVSVKAGSDSSFLVLQAGETGRSS